MKLLGKILVLIAGVVAGFYASKHGWRNDCTVKDSLVENPGKPFVPPLGVIPLQNGVRVQPNLRNGFVRNASNDPRFQTKFVISLSADDLEPFLQDAVPTLFSDQAYAILRHDKMGPQGEEHQEYLTPFVERDRILPQLAPYMFRLIHDGTIGFGIGWYNQSHHEEIFINQKKIITIMTSKTSDVEELLEDYDIVEFQQPKFISDYQTANGDLRSLADLYPQDYDRFKSDEFLPQVYLPGLLKQLPFKKN